MSQVVGADMCFVDAVKVLFALARDSPPLCSGMQHAALSCRQPAGLGSP